MLDLLQVERLGLLKARDGVAVSLDGTIADVIEKAMDSQGLAVLPSLDDIGVADDVLDLLSHIGPASNLGSLGVGLAGIELVLVSGKNLSERLDVLTNNTLVLVRVESNINATAVAVTAQNDVLDLQMLDGISNYGLDAHIIVRDAVGNVSVDENLTGLKLQDIAGRDTTVGATDPENGRVLALAQLGKEVLSVLLSHGFDEVLIVSKDVLHKVVSHVCLPSFQ